MTSTIERTEPGDAASRPWQLPRRPVTSAIVAVTAITAGLWGLHWWGPINPGVDVAWASSSDASAIATINPEFRAPSETSSTGTLDIRNTSQSTMTLESVALTRLGSSETLTTPIPSTEIASKATVAVTVDIPACRNGSSSTVDVELRVRNAVGMPVVLADVLHGGSCPIESVPTPPPPATVVLPAPGVQPVDVPAARTGVTQAFWTVYDGSRTPADRGAMIDDPSGIQVAYAEAERPLNDEMLTNLRSDVRAISFDTPEHAWVDYGLAFGLVAGDSEIGEAVLVDGTWKVTRTTVCRDLLKLNVTCPA